MRRRLQRFLPIVLIALMAQIMAPIAACWAAAIAVGDPIAAVEICHSGSGSIPGQTNDRADDGSCSLCGVLLADASLHTPQDAALSAPHRAVERLVWLHGATTIPSARHHRPGRGIVGRQHRAIGFFSFRSCVASVHSRALGRHGLDDHRLPYERLMKNTPLTDCCAEPAIAVAQRSCRSAAYGVSV